MNKEFVKDLKKVVSKEPVNQVLSPGSTPRRYEPSGGVKKHNERIHKESKYSDNYKNLPFSFRKPPKPTGRTSYVECNNCGNVSCATTATVGIICNACGKFSSVTEVHIDG